MNFLKNVLSTIIGLFAFLLIVFFGFVLIGAIFGGDDQIAVKENSVIELNLEDINKDFAGGDDNPFGKLFSKEATVGVTDIVNAIEVAKTDSKIKGISILNNNLSLGMTQTKAIRNALLDFKKSKKFVVSYADVYSQKEYYLNSVADTIYLNPVGVVDFKGLSTELMFYKDLQEKAGVKMEVIRHGKFKSAVEPFLENKMSDANREQVSTLLNSMWSSVLNEISSSRKISVAQLNLIADSLNTRTPELALSSKLIDKIGYEDQYHDGIRKALKTPKDDDYNSIDIQDYAQQSGLKSKNSGADDTIAVIYAQGEIQAGEGDVNTIGEGSMRDALEEARTNDNIKAIVLRIDSPGGSALTSELIWRAIELTKKTKPVVVSMGNVAASGGYYIACNSNKIFAENTTITGSIGVFGLLPNATELSNRMGLHTDVVSTNANATDYSLFRPLDNKMRAQIQESVELVYSTFVNRVATGRKMTFEQVDAIGQGRVWSGADAIKIGLVDKIGGLNDAIAEAARLSKIKDYRTRNLPDFKSDFKDTFKNFPFASTKAEIISEEIGKENYDILQKIKKITTRKGVQVVMPFDLNIK
jgi:protease IV